MSNFLRRFIRAFYMSFAMKTPRRGFPLSFSVFLFLAGGGVCFETLGDRGGISKQKIWTFLLLT